MSTPPKRYGPGSLVHTIHKAPGRGYVQHKASEREEAVLEYLRSAPPGVVVARRIAEATDMTTGSVQAALVRLTERGAVEYTGQGWRLR